MSFLELLKIEFMKVKRSKIVPLIFIAPLLVVASDPGIYKRMACHVHSERTGLCVLPVAVQYDCCLCDDCWPGNRQ